MIRKRPNDRSANRQQRSTIFQKCTTLKALKQLHASMIVTAFNSNPSAALGELVFALAMTIQGTMAYAHHVFDQISEPNTFMWNTMIRGSAQSLKPIDAVALYTRMERRGFRPDEFTFPFVLKACNRLCWVRMGMGIHGKVVRFGFEFELNGYMRNTLIDFHAKSGDLRVAHALFDDLAKKDVVAWSALTAGYARRGRLGDARRLFDEMPVKDLVSWNVMITGYTKQGEMESARRLFDEVPRRDVVTWNAMIAGYVRSGCVEEALEMFEEMTSLGDKPDEVTMLSLLSACADTGELEIGERIHSSLLEMGSGVISVIHGNSLIDMYSKCGSIERALEVFREMKEKDVSSWNSLIGGLAFHGHAEESVRMFEEMRRLKVRPDGITFVGVLAACSHAGMVEKGRGYFSLMRNGYKIEPNIKHYGCLVDLLGCAGLLDEAFNCINNMEMQSNAIIWRTLLGACKLHGNVELGRRANERLLEIKGDDSGDFVLLSNIYASRGEWDGAEEVRKLMDDSKVKKEVGFSIVESNDSDLKHFLLDSKSKFHR